MSPLVISNFPLAMLFVLAWVGVPLWMIFKRPDTAPDHSEAHAYLAGKAGTPDYAVGYEDAAEEPELQLVS